MMRSGLSARNIAGRLNPVALWLSKLISDPKA
jgi:hypothetical protein